MEVLGVSTSKERRIEMEAILTAFQISLICVGIYATTWPGMIFCRLARWIEAKILSLCKLFTKEMTVAHRWVLTICKPLFGCLICMSSFWTIFYWIISGSPLSIHIVSLMLTVCGINVIITAVISHLIPDEDEGVS